jgi:putative transposase
MILTIKQKHCRDFSPELKKAKEVATFAIKTKSLSSKDVKYIGLKSMIANQVLRKYSHNKKLKNITSVKLTIPSQGITIKDKEIRVPCLDMVIPTDFFRYQFSKINQIEIDKEYLYITGTYKEPVPFVPTCTVGVDLNTTGHCCVAACPETGKVLKLGKEALHIHKKYMKTRRYFQKQKKYKKLQQIKRRESNIIRNLNHKISKAVVEFAKTNNATINLEDLTGIRDTTKTSKSFRYSLSSWNFYQLKQFISYKAKKFGVGTNLVDPRYTSQRCSKCGLLGIRDGKGFKCPTCGHVDHADVNAAFNIALNRLPLDQLHLERDKCNGSTDTPQYDREEQAIVPIRT